MNEIPIPIADLPTEITDINTAQTDYLPVGHKDGMATSRMKVSAITDLINNSIADLKRVTSIRGSVDTYAELLAFDVSPLRDGDSIIVWMDDNNEGLSTLYGLKINGLDHNWIYLGKWTTNAGATFLAELGDVTVVNLVNGQVLAYNGTEWVNAPVTLTLSQTASSVSINNVTIPAASDTMAGAMTAIDRQRMSLLHSGAVIDPADHNHSYVSLADIPNIIQFSAASFEQFKLAHSSALIEVQRGRYVEILQTGNWVVNDSIIRDMSNISIRGAWNYNVYVTDSYPLRLKGRVSIEAIQFRLNNDAANAKNTTALVLSELYSFKCGYMYINRPGYDANQTTPIIEVVSNYNIYTVQFRIDRYTIVQGATNYNEKGLHIAFRETAGNNMDIDIRQAMASTTPGGVSDDYYRTVYLDLHPSQQMSAVNIYTDTGILVRSNLDVSSRHNNNTQLFTNITGSVPKPPVSSADYYLNALGDWVDRSTLFADKFVKNGGTSSQILLANGSVMNDYSTTFTPNFVGQTSPGSATFTTRKGSVLIKGNLAIISIYLVGSFTSTPSGTLIINNLPVTLHSSTKTTYPGGSNVRFQTDRTKIVEPHCYGMGMSLYFTGMNPSTGVITSIDYSSLKSGAFSTSFSMISFLNV